jgi:hypothetical protein
MQHDDAPEYAERRAVEGDAEATLAEACRDARKRREAVEEEPGPDAADIERTPAEFIRQFCPARAQGAGRRVSVPRRASRTNETWFFPSAEP